MQNGFQLIELMIVVVIVGILSAITYPSLSQHFVTAHRLQAQKTLLEIASQLEQYQLVHQTYNDATFAALGVDEFSAGKYYRLVWQVDENSYLLSAVPRENNACGVLGLNSRGEKTAKMRECWM